MTEHEHRFTFEERAGETWSVCVGCTFAERWSDGQLIETTNASESARLDEAGLIERAAPLDPPPPNT